MQAVIMAGGKGTRIASIAKDIPKPMIPIDGKPVLEYGINCLCRQGLSEIILVIGHLGNAIKNYFGDGSRFGARITYYEELEPLGTAGALGRLKEELTEDFLLINGDIIYDVDFARMISYHEYKKAKVTLLAHPNSHPFDSALLFTDKSGQVVQWLHREEPREDYKNRVNAGIHILSPAVLECIEPGKKTDLDHEILKPLIRRGGVFAYDSPEYVKDMGTPERYEQVCCDLQAGRVQAKNLRNKQRAVFLDRDGTINQYRGFLTSKEDFQLIEGAAEGIRCLNEMGFLTVVVTNQPVIARGDCTEEELNGIHQRMERLLGEQGAYIDAIYFCPHHPDKGFAGERLELKFDCECRKPKPGMLLRAAQDFNIDLTKSFLIGDDERDICAGKAAGCHTIRILSDNMGPTAADEAANDLLSCVRLVQKSEDKDK